MSKSRRQKRDFRYLLEKYLQVKGLDIVVVLQNGEEVELPKNRELIDDVIVAVEGQNREKRIPIKDVVSVDLFAA